MQQHLFSNEPNAQCEKKVQKTNLLQILLCQDPNLRHLPREEQVVEL